MQDIFGNKCNSKVNATVKWIAAVKWVGATLPWVHINEFGNFLNSVGENVHLDHTYISRIKSPKKKIRTLHLMDLRFGVSTSNVNIILEQQMYINYYFFKNKRNNKGTLGSAL